MQSKAAAKQRKTAAAAAGQALQGVPSAFMQAMQQRKEGAMMALLQHVPSQQQLVACCTHLHW
jgi:ubiquitin